MIDQASYAGPGIASNNEIELPLHLPNSTSGTAEMAIPASWRGTYVKFQTVGGWSIVKFGSQNQTMGTISESTTSSVDGGTGVVTPAGTEPHVRLLNSGDSEHVLVPKSATKLRYKNAAATTLAVVPWTGT